MTADHVVEHQVLAAIGHMHHLRAGHALEHHAGEMRRGAVALAAEAHLAGARLDVIDQFPERAHRQVLAHDHHIGHRAHQGEWNELLRLVGELLVEALVDGQRPRRAEQQRVAVGLGLVGEIGPDVAAGAGLVLDHDRLAPSGLQLVADDAREHVVDAAAGEGHDDPHCAGREGRLRRRRIGRNRGNESNEASGGDPFHKSYSGLMFASLVILV